LQARDRGVDEVESGAAHRVTASVIADLAGDLVDGQPDKGVPNCRGQPVPAVGRSSVRRDLLPSPANHL
jgi:hypothetical protein